MVSVAPCPDYSPENCARALEAALSGENSLDFVTPGMRVGIKANLVTMMRPESAATTHPELLAALARMIRLRGGVPVIGDSPGGLFTPVYVERVYRAAGMRRAEEAGAELNSDYAVSRADFPDAKAAREFEYTAWLDSCDAVINFCKLKTHGMMGMSAAVKNMFGAVPGTRKPEMHYRFPDAADFADMLVDLNEYFRPALCIVDAVVGMEGNGPTMGDPRPIGCVLAARSPYEADEICAALIGADPAGIPTVAAARRRGLVTAPVETDMDIGPFIPGDFVPAVPRDVRFMAGTPLGALLSAALRARPSLRTKLCVGCGECARVCPASAIAMERGRPEVDRQKCISCFCCQEFCPRGAMVSRRPAVARLFSR